MAGKLIALEHTHTAAISAAARFCVIRIGYEKGSVMAQYRSNEITHKFKIDAVLKRTSSERQISHQSVPKNLYRRNGEKSTGKKWNENEEKKKKKQLVRRSCDSDPTHTQRLWFWLNDGLELIANFSILNYHVFSSTSYNAENGITTKPTRQSATAKLVTNKLVDVCRYRSRMTANITSELPNTVANENRNRNANKPRRSFSSRSK